MLRTKKTPKSRWMLITVVFLGFIILLIAGVLLVRVMVIFSHSHYDGHHELIVEITRSSRTAAVIAFSPDVHTASVLWIETQNVNIPYLEKQLQIPFDAIAISQSNTLSLKQLVSDLFFHNLKSHTTLTLIDAFNLLVYTYSLPASSISQEEINLDKENLPNHALGQLFIDHALYNEASSVSIVNATGVSGVGNTIAKVLTNIGANVIAVNTSNKIEKSSKITFAGKKQYSQTRISDILGIPLSTFPTPSLSDIMVIIGRDKVNDFR